MFRLLLLGNGKPIVLKFGMQLGPHCLQCMQWSHVGYLCTCARAHGYFYHGYLVYQALLKTADMM